MGSRSWRESGRREVHVHERGRTCTSAALELLEWVDEEL